MAASNSWLVDGINIVSFNLHGFKNNWHYLHNLLSNNDVIFVQEHWLLPSELHLLHSVSEHFIVFLKSAMEERCNQGLLLGRPIGGVAFFARKALGNLVKFGGCDMDGRVIYVKLVCNSVSLLLFGCYFPCFDSLFVCLLVA